MMEIINISEKDIQQEDQRMELIDISHLFDQLIQERQERIQREQELLCELDHENQEKTWIRLFGNPPAETALKAFFANPKEGLVLKGSKLITSSRLMELFAQGPNAGMKIRFLSLPGSPVLTGKEIKILAEKCPNIEYLNVNGCGKLNQIYTIEGEWPLLTRLEASGCGTLEKLVSYSPIKILSMSTSRQIEIFVEKPTLDSFMITLANGFYFSFKKGENLQLTPLSTDGFLLDIFRQKAKIEKYFRDDKITLGKYPISSSKDLAVFITEINFQDSNIKTQDIKSMIQLRLINLKKLDLSKNETMRADSLKYLIQGDWPKLTHLDLSENQINDKGFKVLARGDWPLLETLNIQQTDMTANGIQDIVNAPKWVQLKHLNLCGNLKIDDEGLKILTQGNWPLLETLELSYLKITKKGLLNFLLNTTTNWANFQGVITEWHGPHLIGHGLFKKKCPLLEELDLNDGQITHNEIDLIIKNRENWPKLKRMNLCWNLGVHDKALEMLAQEDWPELEIINLSQTRVTKKGLLWFVLNCHWPKLKEIVFGRHGKNLAKDLLRKDWDKLEEVDLSWDHIGQNEIEMIVKRCDWLHLKQLDLSRNQISNEGFRMLAEGNWPLLEILNLRSTGITTEGVGALVNQAKWPKLKHLNLSKNEINDEAIAILCQGDWPLLEILELEATEVTRKALPSFLLHANWPNFKTITAPLDGSDLNLVYSFIQKDLSRVERLELDNSGVGGAEIEAILKRNEEKCLQLKHLNLSNNNIFGKVDSLSLVATECPLLEELLIRNTRIGPEGIRMIVDRSKWIQLKYLNVSNNEVYDEGVSLLALAEWPLLENLNLSNTKLSLKGLETIVNQSKWPQLLKHFDLSNNEIFDEGLSVLALKEWPLLEEPSLRNTKITPQGIEVLVNRMNLPNLKKLDISENAILDEGLKMLSSGKWPLFECLIYEHTQVTAEGTLGLLENFQWPNLNHLEHSLNESFFGYNEALPILSIVSMSSQLVAVLNLNWLNSNEISLSIAGEKVILLPRDKWDQLESIKLSPEYGSQKIKPTQSIIWPSSLKTLDLSDNPLSNNLLFDGQFPLLLENLCLQNTDLTAKDLQNLISKSDWLHLKRLDASQNPIQDEGLEILVSAKWSLLEFLNLSSTKITTQGLENSIRRSKWPNLKTLDISLNSIQDEGLEVLASANWKLLEDLNIQETEITAQGMEIFLTNRSKWAHLKRVDLSHNPIRDDGLEIFIFSNYNLLEYLNLEETGITNKGIEMLVNKANWPKLKELHISDNIITNEGIKMLSSGKWPLLESLSLRKLCCLTEEAIGNITVFSEWPNLKTLNLSDNEGIFDQGVGSLALGKWPLLECLDLGRVPVAPNDVETLIEGASWPNLNEIYLQSRNDYDLDLIQKLVLEKWPTVKLTI